MAITPRSRGLSNIGNIVNRQGLASPTRPMAQPMSRPVAQPMPRSTVQPVTGGRTTLAQRQAMTPFRNYNTAPVAKIDPMTYGPNLAQQGLLPAPMPAPGGPEMIPEDDYMPNAFVPGMPNYGGGKSSSGLFSGNGSVGKQLDFFGSQQQPPQPFNPNPNPVSNMGGGSMPQQQFSNKMFLDANGNPTDDHGGGMMNMNINDFNPSYGGGKSGGY